MTGTRVLLVDDEIPFVEAMNKRLSKRGINILTAFTGQEALELLAAGMAVDIVILDMKMPGMDGLETLMEIKRQHPAVEVIILTGHANMETAIKGMRLGALDYLTKPCELEALIALIEAAMKNGKKGR